MRNWAALYLQLLLDVEACSVAQCAGLLCFHKVGSLP